MNVKVAKCEQGEGFRREMRGSSFGDGSTEARTRTTAQTFGEPAEEEPAASVRLGQGLGKNRKPPSHQTQRGPATRGLQEKPGLSRAGRPRGRPSRPPLRYGCRLMWSPLLTGFTGRSYFCLNTHFPNFLQSACVAFIIRKESIKEIKQTPVEAIPSFPLPARINKSSYGNN